MIAIPRDLLARPTVIGAIVSASMAAAPQQGLAQTTLRACYTNTGVVYRIDAPGAPDACRNDNHVEFSWIDADGADHGALLGLSDDDHADYVRQGEAAGGDLAGTYLNPTVDGLQGYAVAAAPAPSDGDVLTWDGNSSAWAPMAPSGGGAADHGGLIGLGDDDHTQYILADGVRNTTSGFAVTGVLDSGSIPVEGPGVRIMWYPGKGAFRVGQSASGVEWNDVNIGRLSTAMGHSTMATGTGSTAMGVGTLASGPGGAIAMGSATVASGSSSTAMGVGTVASGSSSIAIGAATLASGSGSTAMGNTTVASGFASTAMGTTTTASGDYSTAMGWRASTNAKTGAFVYGDTSTFDVLLAPFNNTFTVRAEGGITFYSSSDLSTGVQLASGGGAWASVSDQNRKDNFRDEDGEAVLAKIAAMSIQSWNYRAQEPSIRHLGPTAQDFYASFGLGESELTITTIDIDGVNMLAIQALESRTADLKKEIASLRKQNTMLLRRLSELEVTVSSKLAVATDSATSAVSLVTSAR